MRIYLLRHAEAHDRLPAQSDADRPLTPRGLRQAETLARAFTHAAAPLDVRPTLMLVSPALRTTQTAAPIAAALGLEPVPSDSVGLDADARDVLRAIQEHAADAAILIVGHNPTMAELAASLGDQPAVHKAEVVAFTLSGATAQRLGRFRAE